MTEPTEDRRAPEAPPPQGVDADTTPTDHSARQILFNWLLIVLGCGAVGLAGVALKNLMAGAP